jgi:hypothetical protein
MKRKPATPVFKPYTMTQPGLKTTERYLGIDQDLTDARCDSLGLEDIKMTNFRSKVHLRNRFSISSSVKPN